MPKIENVLLVRVSSSVDKDVDHPQFFDPCYPLKYIQAGLESRRGVRVHLLDCWIHPMDVCALHERTSAVRPDLVVVSASSFDVHVADRYARALKRQTNPPLIIGIGQGFYPVSDQWNGDRGGGRTVRCDPAGRAGRGVLRSVRPHWRGFGRQRRRLEGGLSQAVCGQCPVPGEGSGRAAVSSLYPR